MSIGLVMRVESKGCVHKKQLLSTTKNYLCLSSPRITNDQYFIIYIKVSMTEQSTNNTSNTTG